MFRNLKLRAPVSTAIAIVFGGITLLAYIFPGSGADLRQTVLSWVSIVAAAALFVGMVNLAMVHLGKITSGGGKALYSFVTLITLILTFVITLLQGAEGPTVQWIFAYIHIPIETSLMALLAVTLTYSSARLLSARTTLYSIVFVIAALLALIASGPFFGFNISFLDTLLLVWSSGGARGILIGVALGSIATGIRILIGADRPFGG